MVYNVTKKLTRSIALVTARKISFNEKFKWHFIKREPKVNHLRDFLIRTGLMRRIWRRKINWNNIAGKRAIANIYIKRQWVTFFTIRMDRRISIRGVMWICDLSHFTNRIALKKWMFTYCKTICKITQHQTSH